MQGECFGLFNVDVLQYSQYGAYDVVLMNPPFGTSKDENIDLAFLKIACKICEGSIYFIHKLARTKVE